MATANVKPARRAATIVPHATNKLPFIPSRIFVGGAGNITLRAVGSAADVVYTGLAAGTYLYVCAQYVRASGTTATALVAEA